MGPAGLFYFMPQPSRRSGLPKAKGGSGKANLWASNATQAQVIADGVPGAKIVSWAFNTERSSVAFPKGRSSAAQRKIAEIVSEAKRTGIVQKAIEQAGLRGVRVAPD